jgi:hypothetical protein
MILRHVSDGQMYTGREPSAPGRSADDALALIHVLDRVPLEVDVLRDVADEREDLAYAVVRDAERGQEVDDRVRDRRRVLYGAGQ